MCISNITPEPLDSSPRLRLGLLSRGEGLILLIHTEIPQLQLYTPFPFVSNSFQFTTSTAHAQTDAIYYEYHYMYIIILSSVFNIDIMCLEDVQFLILILCV